MSASKNRDISMPVSKKQAQLFNQVKKENAAENENMHGSKYWFPASISNGQLQSFLFTSPPFLKNEFCAINKE